MQDSNIIDAYNKTLHNEILGKQISSDAGSDAPLPIDQYKFLICLLLSYPIGYLNHLIRGYYKRLLYSIILGLCLQYYFFRSEMIETVICFFANCFIIKTCNRRKVGLYCTIFSFMHLSYLNLKILICDYGSWKMDITTICMMNLCKHSAFAYNFQDAFAEKENLESTKETKETQSSVSKRRKNYLVEQFNFWEYLGYIYFYPTALMGPFIEYKDYSDFLKEERDYKEIPRLKCLISSLKSILFASLFGLVYLLFKNCSTVNFYFNNFNETEKLNLFNVKEFTNSSSSEIHSAYKILFYFLMLFQKYKYFVAFFLSEGACQASGISWNPSKEANNKVKNIEISVVENIVSINTAKYFQNWNISVHHWLKNYIFFRLYENQEDYKDSAKVQKAKTITFIVSAFWHGFYPCYYVVFGHFAVCMALEANLEFIKKTYPIMVEKIQAAKKAQFKSTDKASVAGEHRGNHSSFLKYVDYLYSITILSCMSYNYAIMESLTIKDTIATMRNFYFIPSIIVIVLFKLSGRYAGMIKKKLKNLESQDSISNVSNGDLKKEN